jgi:hypothetical protein
MKQSKASKPKIDRHTQSLMRKYGLSLKTLYPGMRPIKNARGEVTGWRLATAKEAVAEIVGRIEKYKANGPRLTRR